MNRFSSLRYSLLLAVAVLLAGCLHVPLSHRSPFEPALDTEPLASSDRLAMSSPLEFSAAEFPAAEFPAAEFPAADAIPTVPSSATPAVTPGPQVDRSSLRAAGTDVITTNIFYGIPILQKSFFWDGNGEVDDTGVGVHWLHYIADGVAIGPGFNAATWWTPGSNVYSGELQALLRVHPIDGLPVFLDGSAGFQLANDQIPPGGTVWNYTFGFGLGTEIPIADRTWFQAGAFYHHISNALGRQSARNPSQNEARIWIGFAIDL